MFRCEAKILRTLVGDQNFPIWRQKKKFQSPLDAHIKKLISDPASAVLSHALPAYLSAELEQLQKRAMRIIFPFTSYRDALQQARLETLSARRELITSKLFESISSNENHRLYKLLPSRNKCHFNLRHKRNFNIPMAKTKRLMNTFIYSNCN